MPHAGGFLGRVEQVEDVWIKQLLGALERTWSHLLVLLLFAILIEQAARVGDVCLLSVLHDAVHRSTAPLVDNVALGKQGHTRSKSECTVSCDPCDPHDP